MIHFLSLKDINNRFQTEIDVEMSDNKYCVADPFFAEYLRD
jgi:hypothetical protein